MTSGSGVMARFRSVLTRHDRDGKQALAVPGEYLEVVLEKR